MCGICGIARSRNAGPPLSTAAIDRMRDTLAHRGPDDAGSYVADAIALGHRRLSIIDVAGGAQPMTSDDGRLHIVYNGEIYNHPELKRWLEQHGHVYRTRCDTETVLRLYQEAGARCVERLRGMFAFAIWDAYREELFLARDRLGVKPLYYVLRSDGSLYFASEVKALLEAGAVAPEIDYAQLPDYLANHATSGAHTLFAGVRRLLPGHTLRWRDGVIELRQYWDLSFTPSPTAGDDRALVEEFGERFRAAVRLHLMSDVPLGVFLSGGIDSAAITGVAGPMLSEPIKTFSVAFAEKQANELSFARATATAFGADHHEVVVSPGEFFAALPAMVWHEDEPLAHPSSVALHFVARLAAQHVKVVLTGEGSDELLGGYGRYRITLANLAWSLRYENRVPAAVRELIKRAVTALPSGPLRSKLLRTFLCVPSGLDYMYWDNFAVFSRARQQQLLTPAILERALPDTAYSTQRQLLQGTDALTLLDQLLFVDLKTYLHELLMKQDQMSMSASVESRVPFLDHELVEFSCRLPPRLKLRRGVTKYVLRRSMAHILPHSVLTRPKMGFPVPFGQWVRGPYRAVLDEYLLSDRVRARGVFNTQAVSRIVNEHLAGVDHSERIWSLLNFELWQRTYFDGELASSPASAALAAV